MNENTLFRSATEAKLFLTEIINDLHRHGFERGGKAEAMLHDLARDARKMASAEFPASRLRQVHADLCDRRNW